MSPDGSATKKGSAVFWNLHTELLLNQPRTGRVSRTVLVPVLVLVLVPVLGVVSQVGGRGEEEEEQRKENKHDSLWVFGLVKLGELADSVSQTCSASRGH